MFTFKAYGQRVQHLYQLKTRNIVLTVGDDEDFSPLIRIWNFDKVYILYMYIYTVHQNNNYNILLGIHSNAVSLALPSPMQVATPTLP